MNRVMNDAQQNVNMSETLYRRYLDIKSRQIKKETSDLINQTFDTDLQDTQWFLNWMDSINEESVRY